MSRAGWRSALAGRAATLPAPARRVLAAPVLAALVITAWVSWAVPAGAASASPSDSPSASASATPSGSGGPASLPAVPPEASGAGTEGDAPRGVIADVSGVIADVVPRTATLDGALTTEGETDFTLLSDVYFAFGSAVLEPRAQQDLRAVAEQARTAGVEALVVVGHTDAIGSDADNQALSEARARAVLDALAPLLDGVALTAEGRGETEPVAEETRDGVDFPEGRALNRRVEISPPG